MAGSYIKFDTKSWTFVYEDGDLLLFSEREAITEYLDYTLRTVFDEYGEFDSSVVVTEINTRINDFFGEYEGDYTFEKSTVASQTKDSITMLFDFEGDKDAIELTA